MPLFKYEALDQVGKKSRGKLTAANDLDLEKRLYDLGLDLIDYRELKSKSEFFSASISDKEMILLCMQLEQLEKAGVPLMDSLNDLRDGAENQKLHNLMADIGNEVKNGMIFSTALATHPEVFDEVFVGLVAAGEKTGELHLIFGHLASHLKWNFEIKSQIKKATLYPVFLIVLMCGIIALMMLFVIPKLSSFLTSQNFELPIYTKALIATSDFMQNNWYYVFFGPVGYYFFVKFLCKVSASASYFFDQAKLYLPVFGNLIKKIEIARFCRFFAITYRSGIGILECIDIASNVIMNLSIRDNIKQARGLVSEGISLTAALKASKQFPQMVLRMIKVGEDGGNLDETLDNVNFFYDKEVQDSVTKMINMIQPALTIVMGGLMFWVTIAVFGPLYGSFSKMSF
jgi:type IV pilus assembly protein PilC